MHKPNVSIVLPVYNGEKILPLCLDSLTKLDYPKENLEIIVVDNHSTDATQEMIKRYKVRYLWESKRGTSLALNKGIEYAQGEIIAFTHSDCVVDKKWIKNIVKGFTHRNIGGCAGKVLGYNPQSYIAKYCDERSLYFQNGNIAKERSILPWINLVNAAFHRNILEEVELFDEFIPYESEIDLSWRVYLKGYEFKYIPEAIIYHRYRDNLFGLWRQCLEKGYSAPEFVKKYKKFYESLYLVPYKNPLYIFGKLLQGFLLFLKNLFLKKQRLKIFFPLLDNLVYAALFWGGIFGWINLKFSRKCSLRVQSY